MCTVSLLSPDTFASWPSYSKGIETYSFVVLLGSHILEYFLEEKPNGLIKLPYMDGFGEALCDVPLSSYFML